MHLRPQFSVVIATYHNPPHYSDRQYVAECVESAHTQTQGQPIEVLVMDGGSPDGGPTGLSALGASCGLMPRGSNVCDTFRFGVSAVAGRWVIPINADDRLGPKFIERALHAIVLTTLRPVDRQAKVAVIANDTRPLTSAIERDNSIPYLAMWDRAFWLEMGGWQDVLGTGGPCLLADWDMWIRIWQRFGDAAPVVGIGECGPLIWQYRDRVGGASKWDSAEFEKLRTRLWTARGIAPMKVEVQ